jgi:hypothetical protein
MPLVVLLAVMLVTRAVTEGFDVRYPLRVSHRGNGGALALPPPIRS